MLIINLLPWRADHRRYQNKITLKLICWSLFFSAFSLLNLHVGLIYFEKKFNIKVLDAEYKVREREVHLMTEKYFKVWIDMEKSLTDQFEKLKKALPRLDIYKTALEYIDLRISGTDNEKVIFKKRKI